MKTYHDQLRNNIKIFYLNSIFGGLDAILAPVIVIFQLQLLHLSFTQILIGEAVFAGIVLLSEIPSGIFADRYGRKKCLIWADFLITSGLFLLAVSQNFWHIVLGQAFCGVGIAFVSGAKDALIFDGLKELGQQKTFTKVLSKLNTITFALSILGCLMSGFLADFISLRLPLFLAVIFTGMSFFNLLRLTEPNNVKDGQEKSVYRHFGKSLKFIWKKTVVRYIVIMAMVLGMGMKLSFFSTPIYWENAKVPVFLFGIGFALHNLLAALVSHFAPLIIKKYNDISLLFFMLIIYCGTFLVMAQFNFPLALVLLVPALFQISRALQPVVIGDLIHQITFSHHRATVGSMKSFLVQGTQMICLPIFGYFADLWSLSSAFFGLSALLLVLGIVFLKKLSGAMS